MRYKILAFMLVLSLTLIVTAVGARAQTGGGYDLTWNSLDGGGFMFSTGGGYSLGGTIGQPDAGAIASAGGGYTLNGGFWAGASDLYRVYLPIVIK